jgi:RNase P subunit RPR2
MVKCKGCYAPFAVPDQMDEASFAGADIPTTSLRCPECGIHRPYDKDDYFFGSGEPDLPPFAR